MTGSTAAQQADADPLSNTFSYTLRHPVQLDNSAITMITVRRPLVRDLIVAERQPGDLGSSAALLAVCAGLDFLAVGKFDAEDFSAVLNMGVGLGFFQPGGVLPSGSGTTSS